MKTRPVSTGHSLRLRIRGESQTREGVDATLFVNFTLKLRPARTLRHQARAEKLTLIRT